MRIKSLDAMRGVAALIVVFHHCSLVSPAAVARHSLPFHGGTADPWSWLDRTPLVLLIDGSGAVLVFFVLSGLVLALTYVQRDHERYLPFAVKRVARIWPPFAAAILLSALLQIMIRPQPIAAYSSWFHGSWALPITWRLLAEHLLLVNGTQIELDNPMWSLVHEMRVSLIFPLIVLAVSRSSSVSMAASLLMVIMVKLVGADHGMAWRQVAHTTTSLFLFVGGAAIAVRLTQVREVVRGLKPWQAAALGAVALALLTPAPDLDGADRWLYGYSRLLAAGLGALLLVCLCTSENRMTRLLETPGPMWLGRVSYSLYLIHLPILLTVFDLFPSWDFGLKAALSVVLALVASEPFHRLFERPSMAFGRTLARRMDVQRPLVSPAG